MSRKRSFFTTVLDEYLRHPLWYDLIVIILIWIVQVAVKCKTNLKDLNVDNLLSSLTSSTVSILGFILAALTIIVTVKSNTKIRKLEEAVNAMELILSTVYYRNIVTVFSGAIKELAISLIVTYIAWVCIIAIPKFYFTLLISGNIVVLSAAISRALFILIKIILLEFAKKQNDVI